MNGVFADAVYYIALLNPRDQYHAVARAASLAVNRPVVTTSWVMVEVADALAASDRRGLVRDFHAGLERDPTFNLIGPDREWYDRGWLLYGSRRDKAWSLTDCISFAVMTDLGLTDALTADHHFEQAGFRALMKPGDAGRG